MIKVIMHGYNGRMGRVIHENAEKNAVEIVAGIDLFPAENNKFPVFKNIKDCDVEADVIIDFSHPSAFEDLTGYAAEHKLPLVMCTTGLSEEQMEKLRSETAGEIPVFFSANMSLGVNLLIDLVKKAARFLEGNFDIEIIEKHHNQKLDAPSGTALAIADGINSALENPCKYVYDRQPYREKRSQTEIGIHAVRGGTIVGEHSVIFAGFNEVIEVNHSAMSRDVFAIGAMKAAKYIKDLPPGMYSMSDMLGE